MTTSPVDAAVLRRYLLGQLSESERQRLEEAYFENEDVFAGLLTVEEELASDYLADKLSASDRALFEQEYLKTPGGRQRLSFAQTEARVVSRLEETETPRFASNAASAPRAWPASTPWWQWAAAAVLVASIASTGWMFIENRRLTGELAGAAAMRDDSRRTEQAALQQADSERTKAAQLQAEIAERNQGPGLGAEPAAAGTRATPGLVSLSLLPGLRSSGSQPTLVIRAGVAVVVLRIGFEPFSDLNGLRLTVARQSGDIVSRLEFLQPKSVVADGVLTVTVPAATLSAGAYRATLEHLPRRGAPEPLHTYEFHVVAQ